MALRRALRGLIKDWSAVLGKAFAGFWAKLLRLICGFVFLALFWGALLYGRLLIWPEAYIKMLNTEMDRYSGKLSLDHFELQNASFLNLKDPDIACDMKGESGTTIKTASKVIYEVLPMGQKRAFEFVEMGEIPDQVAYFSCYVKGVSMQW